MDEWEDYKKGFVLNLDTYDRIKEFWCSYWNEDCPPFYHLMPKYNTVNKTNIFRYLLIQVDDDVVLLTYKLVHQFNVFQVRVFGYPIAKNNPKNADRVVDVLRPKKLVRFLLNRETEVARFAHNERIDHCDDFYYDYDKQDVLSSRFVHHHYVNRFLNSPDFSHDMCIGDSIQLDIDALVDMWFKWRDALYYVIPDRTHLEYKKFLMSPLVSKSVLYYKGNPFSITIFDVDADLNIARNYFNTHIGRYYSGDEDAQKVYRNTTQIQKYLIGKYLVKNTSVRKVYTAGADAHTDLTRCYDHKVETSYGCVKYWLCWD